MNKSGIRPVQYMVLIKAVEAEKVTAGGIHLPDEHVARLDGAITRGKVIAASPWAFDFLDDEKKGPIDAYAVPGNTVLFAKYAGDKVEGEDGDTYRLVVDKDILAILDE